LKKLKGPKPEQTRTKSNFQAAGPVDAELRGILIHPSVEMGDERSGVAFIARQPIGLAQRCEILMPVQFPNNLFVTESRPRAR